MGKNKAGRPQGSGSSEETQDIPMFWLSVPKISKPFTFESTPNLIVFSLKSPCLDCKDIKIGESFSWSVNDLKEHIEKLYPNSKIVVVGTSSNSPVSDDQWKDAGFEVAEVNIGKEYKEASIDDFQNLCDDFIAKNEGSTCCVLLHSQIGINRPGFLITGLLCKKEKMKIEDAFKLFADNHGFGIYDKEAVNSLSDIFQTSTIKAAEQSFVDDGKQYPPGDTNAEIERALNWRRFTRKEMKDEDKEKIIEKVKSALPSDWPMKDEYPTLSSEYWNDSSLETIKDGKYLVSFEPRGRKSFLVALDANHVYAITPNMTVYSTQASFSDSSASPKLPFVAICTWVEEHLRISAIMTDILMVGGTPVYDKPLLERQKVLHKDITKRLRSEMSKNEVCKLVFTYRPFTTLKNTKKLVGDFDKLCSKPESLVFAPMDQPAGHTITLDVTPTVLLNFVYNGGKKALLTAFDTDHNVPVAVYDLPTPKHNAFDGYQTRFRFENGKLVPIAMIKQAKAGETVASQEEFNHFMELSLNPIKYDDIFNEFMLLPDPPLSE